MTRGDVRLALGRALSILPKRKGRQLSPGMMKESMTGLLNSGRLHAHIVIDDHAIFMVGEILKLADRTSSIAMDEAGDVGKAHRWLGFLQGILWARGYCSLDELRDMNRPAPSWSNPTPSTPRPPKG